MAINLERILYTRGVLDEGGQQVRSVNRSDLSQVLDLLRESSKWGFPVGLVKLDNLDFCHIDLRGLDLRQTEFWRLSFQGCDFSNAIGCPLVEIEGVALPFGDLAIEGLIELWEAGDEQQLKKRNARVKPTKLDGVWMPGARIDGADFRFARWRKAVLLHCRAQGGSFQNADFRDANLRHSQLLEMDLRGATLDGANLFGSRIENCFLDDIHWGDKHVVFHEDVEDWQEAWVVYRTLTRIHEQAGLEDVAGEFRYRRERAFTKVIKRRIWAAQAQVGQSRFQQWSCAVAKLSIRQTGRWVYRKALDWLFGYGERPWRVFGAVALIVLGCFFFYFEYTDFEWSREGWAEFGNRAGRALYFSAASTTALGYGSWVGQGIGWRLYVGAVQSFVGIFLNALFLVTFTRRWMR